MWIIKIRWFRQVAVDFSIRFRNFSTQWYFSLILREPSWPWSYGSWIYNYLCNQSLLPLMLWVRISIRARSTKLCDNVYQWLATGRWFSPVSSTNNTDRHDITKILLKTPPLTQSSKQTNKPSFYYSYLTPIRSGIFDASYMYSTVVDGSDHNFSLVCIYQQVIICGITMVCRFLQRTTTMMNGIEIVLRLFMAHGGIPSVMQLT